MLWFEAPRSVFLGQKLLFLLAQGTLFRLFKQCFSSFLGLVWPCYTCDQAIEGTVNYSLSWDYLVHPWVHLEASYPNFLSLRMCVWGAESLTHSAFKRLLPLSAVKCLHINYEPFFFLEGKGGQRGKAVGGRWPRVILKGQIHRLPPQTLLV